MKAKRRKGMGKKDEGETSFTRPFFSFGKKGMTDDLFDFLFVVVVAFFVVYFLAGVLGNTLQEKEKVSLGNMAEEGIQNVFLTYLRMPAGEGLIVSDLILFDELEKLKEKTAEFFGPEDCLQVVFLHREELSPEALEAGRGHLEKKVFYCPDKEKEIAFNRVEHSKTEAVELVGPDLKVTEVYSEYIFLE